MSVETAAVITEEIEDIVEAEDDTIVKTFYTKDIANSLADEFGTTKKVAKEIVDFVIEEIAAAVNDGLKFRIPTLGTLKKVTLPAALMNNPQGGPKVQVGARTKIKITNKPIVVE